MKLLVVFGIAVLLVVSTAGQRCKRTAKCPCGSFCVTERGNLPCERGPRPCVCKKGCQVGDIFIPAGETKGNILQHLRLSKKERQGERHTKLYKKCMVYTKGTGIVPKESELSEKGLKTELYVKFCLK